MGKEKERLDYQHQLRMEELAYERETALIVEQYSKQMEMQIWQLQNNPNQANVVNPNQMNPTLPRFDVEPPTFRSQQQTPIEKSRKLYGGGK